MTLVHKLFMHSWLLYLLTFLITFEILTLSIANDSGDTTSKDSSKNKFFYKGRQHALPVIKITSDSKIVKNGSSWKVWNFSKSNASQEEEKKLLVIQATATFPLYIFYERDKHTENAPYGLQKRFFRDFWNTSTYVFHYFLNVKASYLMLKNNSFEFRSNVEPYFGISVRYYFNTNENTVNLQTSPDIPNSIKDYFNPLTHENKDEGCAAHLLIQEDFDPDTGVFKRKYDCYFPDGERGYPGTIQAEINELYFNRYNMDKNCIGWCRDDPNCDEKELWAPSNPNQWTINPHCSHLHEDNLSKKNIYFPPVYVSLPQGKDNAVEIYFSLEDVKMEKMISMDPFEEYQPIGSIMEIRCTLSEAFAGIPFRIALKRKNIGLMFLKELDKTDFNNDQKSRFIIYKFKIKHSDIERIFCFAPVLGSYDWINASRLIHIIVPSAPMFLNDNGNNEGTLEPRVSTFHSVKQFDVGTNEVLVCNATGEPSPEISWTWNKQKVIETKGERKPHQITWSQLWFPDVDKTKEGEYICKATNDLGVIAATFKVLVVDKNDPTLAIAIIVTLLVVLLVAAITVIVVKARNSRRSRNILTEKDCDDFLHGNAETNNSDPNSKIFSKALDAKYIIGKSRLQFNTENVLGSGQYGVVMKGGLTNEHNDVTVVAVKTTKKDVDVMYVKALISEIKIMAYIGDHRNIVGFLGACINGFKEGKIYAAVEFCANGDLLRCLQSHKTKLISTIEITDDTHSVRFNSVAENKKAPENVILPTNIRLNLIQWARDVASGMAFISSKNVIHGDLAARNVLLTKDNVAKISDFGLSRQLLNDYSVYAKKTLVPLPWKWMAPESLTNLRFSVQSDVWSFGITIWEIFSLGDSPFPGCNYDEEFIQKLTTGTRPLKPEFASEEIYKIMESCWNRNPQMRPGMSEIYDQFSQQLLNPSTDDQVRTRQPNYIVLEGSNA